MFKIFKTIPLLLLAAIAGLVYGQDNKCGAIRGVVNDATTRTPLIGANILVSGTTSGAVTNLDGEYAINKIAVGAYSLRISMVGYEARTIADVIVKSDRIAFIDISLQQKPVEMAGVTVKEGFFSKVQDQPVSSLSMSYEEIRRAPGSGGDVSRILFGLPSVAKVNDQTNNLVVRGGSPIENAFYIDNIEVPNINHFPTQGASGGPLSLVNVDFINNVNFYAGGFSSLYGDKLSSVMELGFREGNKKEFDGQLDFNFSGVGGVAEGPLGSKGSWLASVRKSYLDLLVKTIDVGSTVAPNYGDYQGKVVYNLSPKHKLSLLALWGYDHNDPDHETAVENDMQYYGRQDIYERTTGINWQALWGMKGFSNVSLSYTSNRFQEDFKETNTQLPLVANHSTEAALKFRNVNTYRPHRLHTIDFGMDAKSLYNRYDNRYAGITNATGSEIAPMVLKLTMRSSKWGAFVNHTMKLKPRWITQLGVRYDYFNFSQKGHVSPRISTTLQVSELTSLNAAAGIFYQNLPSILMLQNPDAKSMADPKAVHYVLGYSRLLLENTKLTVEAYLKQYEHFPMDPTQPGLFMLDEIFYRYAFFFSHAQLLDNGKADTKGIEVTIQKKLAEKFYGLVSAAYSRARYQGLDKTWRNRVFDNQLLFSCEGGYRPNKGWEFSGRWIYAGGTPYTPMDLQKSAESHREVLLDTQINGERFPAYQALNLRFDKRFNFYRSNMIFYLSVWNIYNHKNIATYFWNEAEKRQDTIYQWGALPIFGLEYEF
jgi:hypothetical protein